MGQRARRAYVGSIDGKRVTPVYRSRMDALIAAVFVSLGLPLARNEDRTSLAPSRGQNDG